METVDNTLVRKWEPVLEGIDDSYTRKVTAVLLENQAKAIMAERMDEDAPTTVGKLGTFQKFAFPLVRRVFPELIANNICGVQPMQGPVSQIFYIGHDRVHGTTQQTVYSKYNLTYRGFTSSSLRATGAGIVPTGAGGPHFGSAIGDIDGAAVTSFVLSDVLAVNAGVPSTTVGGKIASWPNAATILGWSVSAGERLTGTGIPEINFHIEQQPVAARTRKMRALWTIEAAQDLRAYHNMDLESELTGLLSKEVALEIDRELIEDMRMIAYDPNNITGAVGGWDRDTLDFANSNRFQSQGATHVTSAGTGIIDFVPSAYLYDFANVGTGNTVGTNSNIFVIDLTASTWGQDNKFGLAPQHVGQVYANLLAAINFASQDIYKTTWRGPGNWIVTSPVICSMLESAAKLEGGIAPNDAPTNISKGSIQHKGKFMGRYDLYVDPLYPDDEIMIGYKGANAMDCGFVYAPYIPLQQLPKVTDPQDFQPRKGILTRYGKAAIAPAERFFRILRLVGPTANFLYSPVMQNTANTLQTTSPA